jgi:hypothetical protein
MRMEVKQVNSKMINITKTAKTPRVFILTLVNFKFMKIIFMEAKIIQLMDKITFNRIFRKRKILF